MTLNDELKEHMLFNYHIRKYIQSCLKQKCSHRQIMISFEKYVTQEELK